MGKIEHVGLHDEHNFLIAIRNMTNKDFGGDYTIVIDDPDHSFSVSLGLDDSFKKMMRFNFECDTDAQIRLAGKNYVRISEGEYYVYF